MEQSQIDILYPNLCWFSGTETSTSVFGKVWAEVYTLVFKISLNLLIMYYSAYDCWVAEAKCECYYSFYHWGCGDLPYATGYVYAHAKSGEVLTEQSTSLLFLLPFLLRALISSFFVPSATEYQTSFPYQHDYGQFWKFCKTVLSLFKYLIFIHMCTDSSSCRSLTP